MVMVQGWTPTNISYYDRNRETVRQYDILTAVEEDGNKTVEHILVLSYMKNHLNISIDDEFLDVLIQIHLDHHPKSHYLNRFVNCVTLACEGSDLFLEEDNYPKHIKRKAEEEAFLMGYMQPCTRGKKLIKNYDKKISKTTKKKTKKPKEQKMVFEFFEIKAPEAS